LQKLGVIDYCRGHISVLDREVLQALCCERYAVVKPENDRLLPYSHNNKSKAEDLKPLKASGHLVS
jgi:hypothetical protein